MQTVPYRFQLLAPPGTVHSGPSAPSSAENDLYERYLASLQKLRGKCYLADRAIGPEQLDHTGRFRMHRDHNCWHFLLVDPEDEVVGCVRYLTHLPTASPADLLTSHSAIGQDPVWRDKFRGALASDLTFARKNGLTFIEVGGWAIETAFRQTRAALEILLASFAWGRMIGGAIGCCTATFRNSSASMLRRIGGRSLEYNNEVIPPYSDAAYGCMMEALRFHFQDFDPRYQKMVDSIHTRMSEQSTITCSLPDAALEQQDVITNTRSLLALDCALQRAGQSVGASASVSV